MTAVILSRKLTFTMPAHEAFTLVGEFKLWKEGGIGPGDFFGKDSAFMKPKSVVDMQLRKVHLETEAVASEWTRKIQLGQEDPNKFTSDKILVYGQLGDLRHTPYLLLTILDPGHAKMESPDLVRGLGIYYETERADIGKHFPSDDWLAVGFP